MKNLFVVFMFLPVIAFSQMNEIEGVVTYQEIIESPGTSLELMGKVKLWIGKMYANPDKVIKTQTENAVIGKGSFDTAVGQGMSLTSLPTFYQFTIDVKDGKVRYTFTNIEYSLSGVLMSAERVNDFMKKRIEKGKEPLKQHQQYQEATEAEYRKLVSSLKEALSKEGDDW